jgi:hypothetical protein
LAISLHRLMRPSADPRGLGPGAPTSARKNLEWRPERLAANTRDGAQRSTRDTNKADTAQPRRHDPPSARLCAATRISVHCVVSNRAAQMPPELYSALINMYSFHCGLNP